MGEERYQDHKDAEKIKTLEWTIGVKDKQIVNLTEAHEAIVNKLAQALGHITMADTLEDAVDIAMTALNGPPEPTGETMTYDEIFVKLCELRYAATTVHEACCGSRLVKQARTMARSSSGRWTIPNQNGKLSGDVCWRFSRELTMSR
jgi:hypothetical protein